MVSTEHSDDARRILQTSGQLDLAIAYLRGAGYGVVLIMKWAMDVEGYSLAEAKRFVALSPVWKDQDANFENFHDMCQEEMPSVEHKLSLLTAGETLELIIDHEASQSLVKVWMYEGEYVLTWEQCPNGMQYDEPSYLRDERHVFANQADLMDFIDGEEVKMIAFNKAR